MSAELPKVNPLERLDEEAVQKIWDGIDKGLEAMKKTAFPGNKKGSFIPLSLSPDFLASGLPQRAPAHLKYLFEGTGQAYEYQKDLTDETHFSALDLAAQGGHFLASFRVHDWERAGAETYVAVDMVIYIDAQGHVQVLPIAKKAIIAGGRYPGGLAAATQVRVDKLRELQQLGIPTIHIHGDEAKEAVLYEGLYPKGKDEILEAIKTNDEVAARYLPQLVHIARVLDEHKFGSIHFLSDLIFDGEQFRYLDAGADVGAKGETLFVNPSLELLLRIFPMRKGQIEALYAEKSGESVKAARDHSEARALEALE